MVKNSTLFYLVDDLNLLSDTLLSTSVIRPSMDEEMRFFLDLMECDPGTEIVTRTLKKALTGSNSHL